MSFKIPKTFLYEYIKEIINFNIQIKLTLSITKKHPKVCKYLIENGADVKIVDNYKATLLHKAVAVDSVEICDFLLQKGLDINDRDSDGNTCLHYACQDRNLSMAEYLLNKNAKTSLQNGEKKKPLDLVIDFDTRNKFTDIFANHIKD